MDESEKPFAKKILDLREGIKHAVYRIMPDERGALAVALLIGDKSGLSDNIYSDFRDIGISHIICVSGYHLSLWSTLILFILRKSRLDYRLSNLTALAGVVLFMFERFPVRIRDESSSSESSSKKNLRYRTATCFLSLREHNPRRCLHVPDCPDLHMSSGIWRH